MLADAGGGGKGKVTRTYILRGFAKIFIKTDIDIKMIQYGITPEKLQEILKWVRLRGGIV